MISVVLLLLLISLLVLLKPAMLLDTLVQGERVAVVVRVVVVAVLQLLCQRGFAWQQCHH